MSTSTKGGTLVYRCRKCGRIDRPVHVPDLVVAMSCLANGVPLPAEWGGAVTGRHHLHLCAAGEIGLSDLIGGEGDR